ncbi:unnamed protein product [Gadus morhua 'NCC']
MRAAGGAGEQGRGHVASLSGSHGRALTSHPEAQRREAASMEEHKRGAAVQGAVDTTKDSRGEEEEEEEEDFYECQEDPGQEEEEESKQEEEESKQETTGRLEAPSRTQSSNREEEEEEEEEEIEGGGEEEDVAGGAGLAEGAEEEAGGGIDSDFELEEEEEEEIKEEVKKTLEFDDEKLAEAEKDLTEEEKEVRRKESLVLKDEGNALFKSGEHLEAELRYTAALRACPVCFSRERAVLFSNRAAACLHLDRKESAIADCSKALELDPGYVRALLRRAQLYEASEQLEQALQDYQTLLEAQPAHPEARTACMRLPREIEEKNERLKEEMMGKLKDLGNMFLRPFGLSTNNFQVNQDPAGAYSINFVQGGGNNNNTNT